MMYEKKRIFRNLPHLLNDLYNMSTTTGKDMNILPIPENLLPSASISPGYLLVILITGTIISSRLTPPCWKVFL